VKLDYIYTFVGMSVAFVALYKRELLLEKESFKLLLSISIILFLVGLVLHFIERGKYSASGALLSPLMSLGLYRLCRRLFLKSLGREPKDTFMDWTPGMAEDRFFNVVYFTVALVLTMLIASVMGKLAEAGW
jgi:hypothetical protein